MRYEATAPIPTGIPYATAMRIFTGLTGPGGGFTQRTSNSITCESSLPWYEGGRSGKVPCTDILTITRTPDGTTFALTYQADLDKMPADLRDSHASQLEGAAANSLRALLAMFELTTKKGDVDHPGDLTGH